MLFPTSTERELMKSFWRCPKALLIYCALSPHAPITNDPAGHAQPAVAHLVYTAFLTKMPLAT